LYLGFEIHGPGTQVDSGRTFRGNRTLGLKSMVQVHKSTRSHLQARSCGNRTLGMKSMAQVFKPTLVAQVDFNGRNLKPASVAKLLFFRFFIRYGFPESPFRFFAS
jgi:hypothetical protein